MNAWKPVICRTFNARLGRFEWEVRNSPPVNRMGGSVMGDRRLHERAWRFVNNMNRNAS